MKCCVDCKHFTDGRFSKTYISPQCNQRGQDSAAYMRQHICGLAGTLFEPKEIPKESALAVQPPNG